MISGTNSFLGFPRLMEENIRNIPLKLCPQFLPANKLSVLNLLNHPFPPIIRSFNSSDLSSFLSPLPPTTITVTEIQVIPVPPISIVEQLASDPALTSAKSIICIHAPGSSDMRIPPWVITYWLETIRIKPIKQKWVVAEEKLQSLKQRRDRTDETLALIKRVYDMLGCLSWNEDISGFSTKIPIHYLSTYLTTEWLSDLHESQLLDLLQQEIHQKGKGGLEVDVGDVFFISKLQDVYNIPSDYASSPRYAWLRKKGQEIGDRRFNMFTVISNIKQNHWVGIVVNFESSHIYYGDSLGLVIDDRLESALTWWIYYHTGRNFTVSNLPITHQHDTHSCGILAWNAIMVHLFPKAYQLLDPRSVDYERLKIFLRIADRHNDKVRTSSHFSMWRGSPYFG